MEKVDGRLEFVKTPNVLLWFLLLVNATSLTILSVMTPIKYFETYIGMTDQMPFVMQIYIDYYIAFIVFPSVFFTIVLFKPQCDFYQNDFFWLILLIFSILEIIFCIDVFFKSPFAQATLLASLN